MWDSYKYEPLATTDAKLKGTPRFSKGTPKQGTPRKGNEHA